MSLDQEDYEEVVTLKDEPAAYRRIMKEFAMADKDAERWKQNAKESIERYTLEQKLSGINQKPMYPLLWSNVQTLKPAVYLNAPKPQVSRRFKDKDPVGRLAAIVLERCGVYLIDAYGLHSHAQHVRDDNLLSGLGIARAFYDPRFYNGRLGYVDVYCKHVHNADFQFSPCRTWDESRWVRFTSYMSRQELKERFGKAAAGVNMTVRPKQWNSEEGRPPASLMQAEVYEMWDKTSGRVYWLTPGLADKFLEVRDDPYQLPKFFPCPKPLFATLGPNSCRPIPDYIFYKDAAKEVDIICQRISGLERMIRFIGVHNSAISEVGRLANDGIENKLIPADNWPLLQQSGGLQGVMDILPIDMMSQVLERLYVAKDRKLAEIDQAIGISDVVRGQQSDPNKTATATQGELQYAGLRLQNRQSDMQIFLRDLLEIELQLVAKWVEPDIIAEMAGVQLMTPQEQQMFPQAIQLIKDDQMMSFRLDIETSSTIAQDEESQKQQSMEFITATSNFVDKVAASAQQNPDLFEVAGESLLYVVRNMRAGRSLEAVIENWIDKTREQIEAAEANPQPPPPDPEMLKIQGEAQKVQMQQQKDVAEFQLKQQQAAAEFQLKQQELAIEQEKVQLEREKVQLEREKVQVELAMRNREIESNEQIESARLFAQQEGGDLDSDDGPDSPVSTVSEAAIQRDPLTGRMSGVVMVNKPINLIDQ